jgi:multidrug transporter EmrE-like cation transporter
MKCLTNKMGHVMGYLYIFGTIFFTVYGQLVIKWQVSKAGLFPREISGKIFFFLKMICNPWVISSLAGAFLAFLCWIVAMTKFELSYAYPFMSLSFVLVMLSSASFFHEPITLFKSLGVGFIIMGIVIGSR